MSRQKQLISSDQAVSTSRQHKNPCSDCPFSRKALPGWLGSLTAEQWVENVHGEAFVECHTKIGPQCAGTAIYRANVCKSPRDPKQLDLPQNTKTVFASPQEFIAHHAQG